MEKIIGGLKQLDLKSGVLDSGLSSISNSWLSCLIDENVCMAVAGAVQGRIAMN